MTTPLPPLGALFGNNMEGQVHGLEIECEAANIPRDLDQDLALCLYRVLQEGLNNAVRILEHVEGISFTFFSKKDVVRHPLVQRIVEAYGRADSDKADKNSNES